MELNHVWTLSSVKYSSAKLILKAYPMLVELNGLVRKDNYSYFGNLKIEILDTQFYETLQKIATITKQESAAHLIVDFIDREIIIYDGNWE